MKTWLMTDIKISVAAMILWMLVACPLMDSANAQTPPEVTNVLATQRTGSFLVDITYDLADADGDPSTISFFLSVDAGLSYPNPIVSVTGDVGPGIMPGIGKQAVWDAGADYPEFFGTECSIRVIAEEEIQPDGGARLVVLFDRSGSMGGQLAAVVDELSEFFQDPGTANLWAGLNFYPVDGVADQCDVFNYDPLQVPEVPIPAGALTLVSAMNAQTAIGNAPTYAALYGSLTYATNRMDFDPDTLVAVVLLTDGAPTACITSYNELANLASAAYNYNGAPTYVVGLPGAEIANLEAVASAGGTSSVYDVTGSLILLSDAMAAIALDAASR